MSSHQAKKSKRAAHPTKALAHGKRLLEFYHMPALVENSYVLSSIWAWLSRIEMQPELRIPVPRILTTRDP